MLWIERASALLVPIGLSSQMSFDEELLDAAVDLFAKPRHLALRDVGHAHRLDQVVDGSRRDAVHVGFGSPRSWPCRRGSRNDGKYVLLRSFGIATGHGADAECHSLARATTVSMSLPRLGQNMQGPPRAAVVIKSDCRMLRGATCAGASPGLFPERVPHA